MIFKVEDRCQFCANYLQNQTCKAFPDGIPETIWNGSVLHDDPIEGDHGIMYQSRHLHFIDYDKETGELGLGGKL